jgi:ubiquinone/menaquinone biosynthesis C-methylase UbiE
MNTKSNIKQARQQFDQELHQPAYAKITADDDHLAALIKLMDIQNGSHYLDLGTGNGYIAFELAQKFNNIFVTGLDITPHSIQQNSARQQGLGLNHLDFQVFDGFHFPFEGGTFYGMVCRYAFHHFPDPTATLLELRRILNSDGFMLISDPWSEDEDEISFVDDFQRLRKDGHVHFYKRQELIDLFHASGFMVEEAFTSSISYPRTLTPEYIHLLDATPAPVLQKYQIKVKEQQVFITTQVMNIRFRLKDRGQKTR